MKWSRNNLALVGGFAYAVWIVARSPLFSADALTAITALALLGLCIGPAAVWLLRGMKWLPLFEVYCLCHFSYYWTPATRKESVLWQIPENFRILLLAVVCTFLLCGAIAYYWIVSRLLVRGRIQSPFWSKPIDSGSNAPLFWLCLIAWAAFQVATMQGWMPDFGSAFSYVRSVCTVAGMLGLFYFSDQLGRRALSRSAMVFFLGLVIIGVAFSFASGFLVLGAIVLCSGIFAFAMSRRSVPLVSAALVFAVLNFLNIGKSEFRQKFWVEDIQGTPAGIPITELFSYWIESSCYNIAQGKSADEEEEDTTLSSRTDLTRMLGIVVSQTPFPLPYLRGESYIQSLALFVPKIFWKDRPDIHYPMQRMGLYYGIHTSEESMEHTSISLGQIAEAWGNFGWLGVILVGAFFGAFFGWGVSVSMKQSSNSIGYYFGTMFISGALNLEHSLGPFLMQFYQAALVGILMLYLLSVRALAAANGLSLEDGVPVPPGENSVHRAA